MGTPAPSLTRAFSADISDLFFNLDHEHNKRVDGNNGQFDGFNEDKLLEETKWFLDSLRRLGVGCLPTNKELVEDFLKRV